MTVFPATALRKDTEPPCTHLHTHILSDKCGTLRAVHDVTVLTKPLIHVLYTISDDPIMSLSAQKHRYMMHYT